MIMNRIISYLSQLALNLYGRELSVKKALDVLLKDGYFLELLSSRNVRRGLEKIKKCDILLLFKNKYKNRKSIREMIVSSNLYAA